MINITIPSRTCEYFKRHTIYKNAINILYRLLITTFRKPAIKSRILKKRTDHDISVLIHSSAMIKYSATNNNLFACIDLNVTIKFLNFIYFFRVSIYNHSIHIFIQLEKKKSIHIRYLENNTKILK